MVTVLHCGVCGAEIHRALPDDLRDPSVAAAEFESAAAAHLSNEHSWRYRLWEQLGWRWLVRGFA